jgi:hypothetical protein
MSHNGEGVARALAKLLSKPQIAEAHSRSNPRHVVLQPLIVDQRLSRKENAVHLESNKGHVTIDRLFLLIS